jgi:hypothetical protein
VELENGDGLSLPLLDAAGRRRSLVMLPGYLAGRPPRNTGLLYTPEPPTVEEIVAVMRQAGDRVHGARMRALIVLLWRAGLRINEALLARCSSKHVGRSGACLQAERRSALHVVPSDGVRVDFPTGRTLRSCRPS